MEIGDKICTKVTLPSPNTLCLKITDRRQIEMIAKDGLLEKDWWIEQPNKVTA